jgi:hypothetical protein
MPIVGRAAPHRTANFNSLLMRHAVRKGLVKP